MRSTALIPIAVLAFAVACSDSTTAPVPTVNAPSFAVTWKPRSGPTVDFVSTSSGNLSANFDISGLGNLPSGSLVTVEASAFAEAQYACQNNGGNFPSDPKKQALSDSVKVDGDFPVKNGRAQGTLVLQVPASTLSCPGGQHPVLVSVTWSDVVIEVTSPPGPTATSNNDPNIQPTYEKCFVFEEDGVTCAFST